MNKGEELRVKIRILKERELIEKMKSKDKKTATDRTIQELKDLRKEMRNYLLKEKEGKVK